MGTAAICMVTDGDGLIFHYYRAFLNPATRVMCIGSFIRCRYVLVVMGFFAIANCYALRFKLSVAIVVMVNLTYVREYDAAAKRLLNSSDVGSSRYHSDDQCVTADENTTDVHDHNVAYVLYAF